MQNDGAIKHPRTGRDLKIRVAGYEDKMAKNQGKVNTSTAVTTTITLSDEAVGGVRLLTSTKLTLTGLRIPLQSHCRPWQQARWGQRLSITG